MITANDKIKCVNSFKKVFIPHNKDLFSNYGNRLNSMSGSHSVDEFHSMPPTMRKIDSLYASSMQMESELSRYDEAHSPVVAEPVPPVVSD